MVPVPFQLPFNFVEAVRGACSGNSTALGPRGVDDIRCSGELYLRRPLPAVRHSLRSKSQDKAECKYRRRLHQSGRLVLRDGLRHDGTDLAADFATWKCGAVNVDVSHAALDRVQHLADLTGADALRNSEVRYRSCGYGAGDRTGRWARTGWRAGRTVTEVGANKGRYPANHAALAKVDMCLLHCTAELCVSQRVGDRIRGRCGAECPDAQGEDNRNLFIAL